MRKRRTAKTESKTTGPTPISFLNDAQKRAWQCLERNDITFLIGPAGTAKTFVATAYAVDLVQRGEAEKIIVTRPVVEAGESLGFLPGNANEKIAPYLLPFHATLEKLRAKTIKNEAIPLAFLRGVTFENCVCILDEAQNATIQQMRLYLSRFGQNCKMVVTGDTMQSDIGRDSGLDAVANAMKGIEGVGVFKFSPNDIVRHRLVGQVLRNLSSLK